MFEKMIENKYKKRYETQRKIVSRQLEQIKSLELEIEELEKRCKEKDDIINSVEPMRNELMQSVAEIKECKKEYKSLIEEVKKMKTIMNQDLYKGRWWLIRFLIK